MQENNAVGNVTYEVETNENMAMRIGALAEKAKALLVSKERKEGKQ